MPPAVVHQRRLLCQSCHRVLHSQGTVHLLRVTSVHASGPCRRDASCLTENQKSPIALRAPHTKCPFSATTPDPAPFRSSGTSRSQPAPATPTAATHSPAQSSWTPTRGYCTCARVKRQNPPPARPTPTKAPPRTRPRRDRHRTEQRKLLACHAPPDPFPLLEIQLMI